MEPSIPEIEFSHIRRRLQSVLDPLLTQQIRRKDITCQKFGSRIDTPEGRPQENTLRGQINVAHFEMLSPAGGLEIVDINIGHDESWNALASVASTMADAPETFVLAGNEKEWTERISASVTAAFDCIAKKS